jgi:phosphoribosylglycinamide formyltransferase-1
LTLPRLVVLVSGRGRNLQALAESVREGRIPARLAGVVSTRADAPALAYARAVGLPHFVLAPPDFPERTAYDAALAERLRSLGAELIALAGFMRVLGAQFVRAFEGRMLNIHPALLPKYPGLDTHRRVLAAGDAEHGATVHFVTRELDGGPRVIQGALTVGAQDDAQTLAARVLEQIELKIYPQAVAWLARGELRYAQGAAWFRGRRLDEPLGMDHLEEGFR